MPTLQDITVAHSRRISELHQRRDGELRDALVSRDTELRSLSSTAALYQRHDKATALVERTRAATERKAADARDAALSRASDTRTELLTSARAERKDTDLEAHDRHVRAEAVAETKFRDTLASVAPATPLDQRQKISQEAERVRQRELDAAREAHVAALAAAQKKYRDATDAALSGAQSAEQTAEHAYAAALRVAESSYRAALASAEQELAGELQGIPEARAALERYQGAVTRITADSRREEADLFQRFREELHTVG